MQRILLRRGSKAELDAIQLENGEPAFTSEGNLYVGSGTSNILIGGASVASGSLSTVHLNGAGAIAVDETNIGKMVHIESGTSITLAKASFTKDSSFYIQNHSGVQLSVNFTGAFEGVYDAGKQSDLTTTQTIPLEYLEIMFIVVTENSGSKFINFTKLSNKTEVGSYTPTITFTAVDPDISTATIDIYSAKYTKIGNLVTVYLNFGLSGWTAGRYLTGTFTLPKTKLSTEPLIATGLTSTLSQYIPFYVGNSLGNSSIFFGSNDIRLPSMAGITTVSIIASYVTNEV